MTPLEKAWKKLVEEAEYTCDGYYGPEPVLDAARTLSLAVHVQLCRLCGPSRLSDNCEGRARIEALE